MKIDVSIRIYEIKEVIKSAYIENNSVLRANQLTYLNKRKGNKGENIIQ